MSRGKSPSTELLYDWGTTNATVGELVDILVGLKLFAPACVLLPGERCRCATVNVRDYLKLLLSSFLLLFIDFLFPSDVSKPTENVTALVSQDTAPVSKSTPTENTYVDPGNIVTLLRLHVPIRLCLNSDYYY